MKKIKDEEAVRSIQSRLKENAFDFFGKATDEIRDAHEETDEQKRLENLKFSVVHFSTAIELLLKSRLLREHWTLIVSSIDKATWNDFCNGRCHTITAREAVERYKKFCAKPTQEDATKQFQKIFEHRNRMIHFFPREEDTFENVTREIFIGFYNLLAFLSAWIEEDKENAGAAEEIWEEDSSGEIPLDRKPTPELTSDHHQVKQVEWYMNKLKPYLKVVYEKTRPEIEKMKEGGATFEACPQCGYEAAEVKRFTDNFGTKNCKVCRTENSYAEFTCSKCSEKMIVSQVDWDYVEARYCSGCKHGYSGEETVKMLRCALRTTRIDYSDPEFREMHCAECSSVDSVVEHDYYYICTHCLCWEESLFECAYCGGNQLGGGDPESGLLSTCIACEGVFSDRISKD